MLRETHQTALTNDDEIIRSLSGAQAIRVTELCGCLTSCSSARPTTAIV